MSFLSFKGITHAYLLKILRTHHKKRIPLLNLLIICIFSRSEPQNPAGIQRPWDAPPPYGPIFPEFPDHNRTKRGCIRFLTYFGSAMSVIHWHQEIYKNIFLKTYLMGNVSIDVLRMSQGRPAASFTLGRF